MAEITNQGENRFAVSGELSFDSVPGLLRQSGERFNGVGSAEVDLASARAMDSSAVAILVEWARQFELKGGEIRFTNVPDPFRDIARISELDHVLDFS